MIRHGEDKSYIIQPKDIPSFKKLMISEIPFTTKQDLFGTVEYNIAYKYGLVSDNNFRRILKVIPVDLYKKNILKVFNDAAELLKKHFLNLQKLIILNFYRYFKRGENTENSKQRIKPL
jgi:hypothetical protein